MRVSNTILTGCLTLIVLALVTPGASAVGTTGGSAAVAAVDHECEVYVFGVEAFCYGQQWCTNNGICGQQICATPSHLVCILNPPDPSDCLYDTGSNGVWCEGEEWCNETGCGQEYCLTDTGRICINSPPDGRS